MSSRDTVIRSSQCTGQRFSGVSAALRSHDGQPPVRRSLGQAVWLLGPGGCARVMLSGPARMVRAGHATLRSVERIPGLFVTAARSATQHKPLLDRAETLTSGAAAGVANTAVDKEGSETADVYGTGQPNAVE